MMESAGADSERPHPWFRPKKTWHDVHQTPTKKIHAKNIFDRYSGLLRRDGTALLRKCERVDDGEGLSTTNNGLCVAPCVKQGGARPLICNRGCPADASVRPVILLTMATHSNFEDPTFDNRNIAVLCRISSHTTSRWIVRNSIFKFS